MINNIINGATSLLPIEIIIRSFILYLSVILATRLMGKRQVGILSGHNYLVAAGIVSLVAVRMVNPNTSLISGLVIVFTYAIINRLWSYLDLKFPNIIDRKPITLMKDGIILYNKLKKAQVSIDDLLMELRGKKIWNLSNINNVILEPTGDISVLKKTEYSPVSAKDLDLKPNTVISPPEVLYYKDKQYNTSIEINYDILKLQKNDPKIAGIIFNPDKSYTLIRKD